MSLIMKDKPSLKDLLYIQRLISIYIIYSQVVSFKCEKQLLSTENQIFFRYVRGSFLGMLHSSIAQMG